jgi:hypothetical protein
VGGVLNSEVLSLEAVSKPVGRTSCSVMTQGERVRRPAPLRAPGNRSRLVLFRHRGEYGCVWAAHARRTDAPGVPLDDADHTGRTRRDESARAVSSCAVRGTLRIAPATEPARPALPEIGSRIQRFADPIRD